MQSVRENNSKQRGGASNHAAFFIRMISKLRFILFFIFLTLMGLALAGCEAGAEREWAKTPSWSRIPTIGRSAVRDPAPLAIDTVGNLYLFLLAEEGEAIKPKLIAYDRQMQARWIRVLDMPLTQPDKPAIIWANGRLQLFWLSDESLFTAQISADGELLSAPELISGAVQVGSFAIAVNEDDAVSLWFAGPRRNPGLYAFAPDDVGGTWQVVAEDGLAPVLRYDATGTLHVGWVVHPSGFATTSFWYGAYANGRFQPESATAVYATNFTTTDILSGPQLGLDATTAYLFWNVSVRTGTEAGKVVTQLIRFPLGQPTTGERPQAVSAPVEAELTYDWQFTDGLAVGARARGAAYPATAVVRDLTTNQPPTDELAIAFAVESQHQFRKFQDQIGVQFWQDGAERGYQLISFTTQPSFAPFLLRDEEQQLYLTWLERGVGSGYEVYFSTTAEDVTAVLAPLTRTDFTTLVREVTFGLLSGMVFAPIVVFVWLILPMIALFLTAVLRQENKGAWTTAGLLLSFALALIAYTFSKAITLPGMLSYVPLSAWVPQMSQAWQTGLQYGLLPLFALAGLFIAWRFTYAQGNRSALYFMALFGVVDGLLTLAVYGVLIYNSF